MSSFFQYGDMASQCYRVVNCDRHIDGWSRAQYTKYVAVSPLFWSFSCRPAQPDLTMVRTFVPLQQRMTHSSSTKVETSYDTILEACTTLHTRRGLVNSIGVLAVDVVLLLAMLIGLLRSAHKNSTGIWYLLYQQVSTSPSFYPCRRS